MFFKENFYLAHGCSTVRSHIACETGGTMTTSCLAPSRTPVGWDQQMFFVWHRIAPHYPNKEFSHIKKATSLGKHHEARAFFSFGRFPKRVKPHHAALRERRWLPRSWSIWQQRNLQKAVGSSTASGSVIVNFGAEDGFGEVFFLFFAGDSQMGLEGLSRLEVDGKEVGFWGFWAQKSPQKQHSQSEQALGPLEDFHFVWKQ